MSNKFIDPLYFVFNRASIRGALFFGENLLSIPRARFEAEVLLGALLSVERIFFRTQSEFQLSFFQRYRFYIWLLQRNKKTPVAYIIGHKEWVGMKILVNKHTLVPRDETEVLIEHIKNFKRDFVPRKILDVGTGSGCIALALQRIFLDVSITGLDLSTSALRVAIQNESQILVEKKITWLHSNLLQKISFGSEFDIIVANLPYVPTKIAVTKEVGREPSTAIFSGGDGLNHIRRLATELRTKKIRFKELWLEFLPEQEPSIGDIFGAYEVRFLTDVGGDVYFAVVTHTQ